MTRTSCCVQLRRPRPAQRSRSKRASMEMTAAIVRVLTLCCLATGSALTLPAAAAPLRISCTLHARCSSIRAEETAADAMADEVIYTEPTMGDSVPKVFNPGCEFPGCDGNGRVMGGLGAIPLFSWWPIKVCACSPLPRHCLTCRRALLT